MIGKKRAEIVAAICAGLFLAYMVGYYDGARTRHQTTQEDHSHE
jgi:hypothetical protein